MPPLVTSASTPEVIFLYYHNAINNFKNINIDAVTFPNIQSISGFPQGSWKCLYNFCFLDPDPTRLHMVSIKSLWSHSFSWHQLWINLGLLSGTISHILDFPDCSLMITQFGQEDYRGDALFLLDLLRNYTRSVCPSNSDATFDHLVKELKPDLSILKVPFSCEIRKSPVRWHLKMKWVPRFPTTLTQRFSILSWINCYTGVEKKRISSAFHLNFSFHIVPDLNSGSTINILKLKKKKNPKLPWWLRDKESTCPRRRHGFNSWSSKIPHAEEQISPCTTTTKPVL